MYDMDSFEVLDETIYPITHIYDTVQDKHVHIDEFDFAENFWDNARLPEIDMKELFRQMNKIELSYKSLRQLVQDEDLCEFLKDTVGFDINNVNEVYNPKKRKLEEISDTVPESIFEVDHIVNHSGDIKYKRRCYFLVRWKDYSEEHDTWEPYSNLTNCSLMIKNYVISNNAIMNVV